MRFKISAFLIALVCLCSLSIGAAPVPEIVFQASFSGSRLTGLTRPTTVGEWRGDTVDGSGNLLDVSGQNMHPLGVSAAGSLQYVTLSTNAIANPIDGQQNGSIMVETADNSIHNIYNQYTNPGTGVWWIASLYVKPINRQWFFLRFEDPGTSYIAYFNLTGNGSLGTVASGVVAGIQKANNGWYRIYVARKCTTNAYIDRGSATSDGGSTYIGTLGLQSTAIYGFQLEFARVGEERTTPGMLKPTTTVAKPLLDLAPGGSPVSAQSDMQSPDGNRQVTRYLNSATSDYYDRAHDNALNFTAADHTITMVFRRYSGTTGTKVVFRKTSSPTADGGIYIFNTDTSLTCRWGSTVGTDTSSVYSADLRDNIVHIVQVVRSNNNGTIYVDGVAGSTVAIGSNGNNNTTRFTIGASVPDLPGFTFPGNITYVRVDKEALSTTRLAEEREILRGISSNRSRDSAWTYVRNGVNYYPLSTNGIVKAAINVPRVGGDGGGIYLEGSTTNYCLQSQTFETTWTQVALTSVSSDILVAPDGTTTMDGSVGTAVDTQHGFTQAVTTTAAKWTFSIYATPGNKNWIYLANSTIANAYAYFDIANGRVGTTGAGATARMYPWGFGYRCEITMTATAASNTFQAYSANADADNDFAGDASTINTYWWGGQIEPMEFASSYVPTTSGALGRNSDGLSRTTGIGIPIVSSTSPASKIRVSLEVKTRNPTLGWSGDNYGSVIYIGFGANEYFGIYTYRTTGYRLEYSGVGDSGAEKVILSTNMGVVNSWNKLEAYLDTANLSNSYIIVNGTRYSSWFALPSSTGFSSPATSLWVGSSLGALNYHGWFRNLTISVQ